MVRRRCAVKERFRKRVEVLLEIVGDRSMSAASLTVLMD
jgi:hypothetical protein